MAQQQMTNYLHGGDAKGARRDAAETKFESMIRGCCSWDPLSLAQLVHNVSGVRVGEDLS